MTDAPRTIAILFEFPTLHGGERSMLACLDELARRQRRATFVVFAPPDGPLAEAMRKRGLRHLPWSIAGLRPEQRAAAVNRLREQVEDLRPDLLHANSLAMGRLTGQLAPHLPCPTSSHLRDIVKLSRAAVADLNRNQRLFAVSEATRAAHLGQGLAADRVQVVSNGIDLVQFRPRSGDGRLRQLLHVPSTARIAVTIGQIGLRKGQVDLAIAAPAIVHAVPNVHFVLVGDCISTKAESQAYAERVGELFAEHGLSDRLHRLGYRDDIADLLPEAVLLIHPARQEPYGRVLLEAAACGIPVVATNVGGTAEIVIPDRTGVLVPPADPVALANAAIGILSDGSRRRALALAARTHAEQSFSIATAAERLWHHWSSLLTT